VPAQDHEALLGDLYEEFQRGRSVSWYWIQIAAGILVGSWNEMRAHRLLVLRAIVIGLVTQALVVETIFRLNDVLGAWGSEATFQAGRVIGYVLVGWLIVRLHRDHGIAMVLAYRSLVLLLPFEVLLHVLHVLRPPGPGYFHSVSLAFLNGFVIDPSLMLLGGYFATRPKATR
jgi:hypothetical protein